MNSTPKHPFDLLSPDLILDAMESQGFVIDGRVSALNSFENRVYQIGLEDSEPVIAKFYRPNRWTQDQIQEEHDFSFEAHEHDLPIVTPLKNPKGESLYTFEGFVFSLFPRKGGHAPELDHQDNLAIMGRTLARLHNVGSQKKFVHRTQLDANTFGHSCVTYVAEQFIPMEHKTTYLNLASQIMPLIEEKLIDAQPIRVHGDLHIGNILMRDEIPNLVDFDDSRAAPAIQDIWMLLSGEPPEQQTQLQKIIQAYDEFRAFPFNELTMIESLRTLRMIHHTAWLARRWDDPAFPPAFPWFNSHNFWGQHIIDLQHQLEALQSE
ncbi:MAG: serine/threonine protein kinase [Marinicella sp.]